MIKIIIKPVTFEYIFACAIMLLIIEIIMIMMTMNVKTMWYGDINSNNDKDDDKCDNCMIITLKLWKGPW